MQNLKLLQAPDKRAKAFAESFGGEVMPIPYQIQSRSTRSWTPLNMGDGGGLVIERGEWIGEWGWGIGDRPAIRINLKTRLAEAKRAYGQNKNIPLAAVPLNMAWIFDTLKGGLNDPQFIAAKQIQDDTLELILRANGVGHDKVPKQHARNKAKLIQIGAAIIIAGKSQLNNIHEVSNKRRDTKRVMQEARTAVVHTDNKDKIISVENREEQILEDGPPIVVDYKRDG